MTYPCYSEDKPGESVVLQMNFQPKTEKLILVPANPGTLMKTRRRFPFVLITGRQLEHWHTGSMTSKSDYFKCNRTGSDGLFEQQGYGATRSTSRR